MVAVIHLRARTPPSSRVVQPARVPPSSEPTPIWRRANSDADAAEAAEFDRVFALADAYDSESEALAQSPYLTRIARLLLYLSRSVVVTVP